MLFWLRRLMSLAILAGGVFLVFWIFSYVDDWGRDLTTNQARSDPAAEDPDHRPLYFALPLQTVGERVEAWAEAHPQWRVLTRSYEDDEVVIRMVYTTPVMHFRDDVHAIIEHADGGRAARLVVDSASRIGFGDLGQNPRNIAELTRGLRQTGDLLDDPESFADDAPLAIEPAGPDFDAALPERP